MWGCGREKLDSVWILCWGWRQKELWLNFYPHGSLVAFHLRSPALAGCLSQAPHPTRVSQSRPILWDSMDYCPPGSSVCGIFQARILEWVAIPFSRGSSRPKNRTWFSCVAQILYHLSHHGSPHPTWDGPYRQQHHEVGLGEVLRELFN